MCNLLKLSVLIGLFVPLVALSDVSNTTKTVTPLNYTEQSKKFYKTDSKYAKFLLAMPARAANEIKIFKGNNDVADTHLKATFNEIKLAFPFQGLPSVNKNNIIGYAAIGGWHDGWTGIKVFFKQNKSMCSYSYFDLATSHGASPLDQNSANKSVNGKMTFIDVEGNKQTGILYSVNWFDKKTIHELGCASETENKSFITKVIILARQLDKDIS